MINAGWHQLKQPRCYLVIVGPLVINLIAHCSNIRLTLQHTHVFVCVSSVIENQKCFYALVILLEQLSFC